MVSHLLLFPEVLAFGRRRPSCPPCRGECGVLGLMVQQVICQMEGSGQWPRNKEAIQRIKAAFQLQLAEVLNEQHHLLCRPSATYTDIYKNGYVFRLRVVYHREPQILKEVVTPEGMLKYQESPESQQLELETLHLPFLTSSLHGLQQQYPAFSGSCRLAKRWISAQMLSDSLAEEAVDLLAAFLFLSPAPFTAPSSPQVGFLRFLHLLASFDWKNSPLLVNLNGDLKGEVELMTSLPHLSNKHPDRPHLSRRLDISAHTCLPDQGVT
ncbi:hypothetical protein Chor_013657 [Crotalus horridus]